MWRAERMKVRCFTVTGLARLRRSWTTGLAVAQICPCVFGCQFQVRALPENAPHFPHTQAGYLPRESAFSLCLESWGAGLSHLGRGPGGLVASCSWKVIQLLDVFKSEGPAFLCWVLDAEAFRACCLRVDLCAKNCHSRGEAHEKGKYTPFWLVFSSLDPQGKHHPFWRTP